MDTDDWSDVSPLVERFNYRMAWSTVVLCMFLWVCGIVTGILLVLVWTVY